MALGLLGMMIVSCAKNQEMTDQQKMQEFDFAVFEEKTVDVLVQNDLGEFVQAPVLLTDGPKILGYGVTNENGEIHMPISWHAGMDLEVHVGNNNKVDVGDLNHPVALTYNAPRTSTNKTETIIDTDGDGVTDSLDIDPNDSRFVSYSSASGRFMFEDIYPWKGDYDFNDVVVDYQLNAYLDNNHDVRKVTMFILPINDGAGSDNEVRLRLPEIEKTDIQNFVDSSSFDDEIVQLNTSEANWRIFEDFHEYMTGRKVLHGDTLTFRWMSAWTTNNGVYEFLGTGRIDTHGDYEWTFSLPDSYLYEISSVKRFVWSHTTFERQSFDSDELKLTSISFELPSGYRISDITTDNLQLYIQTENKAAVFTKEADSTYQDNSGMPFGVHVPQEVMWPEENEDITEKYTDFTAWATSNGTTNQNWWE